MVMTLGTMQRQAQDRSADDLQRIGDDLVSCQVLIDATRAGAIRSHPQETGRYQTIGDLGLQFVRGPTGQLIARQLLLKKLRVRFVGVKCTNHVVAITIRMLAHPILLGVTLRVGITGRIQPVPAPTLAIMRRSQHAIDQRLPSCGTGVFHKLTHLFRRWW